MYKCRICKAISDDRETWRWNIKFIKNTKTTKIVECPACRYTRQAEKKNKKYKEDNVVYLFNRVLKYFNLKEIKNAKEVYILQQNLSG